MREAVDDGPSFSNNGETLTDGLCLENNNNSAAVSNGREFSMININTVEYAIPSDEFQFVEYLGGGNYGNVIKVRACDGQEFAVKKMYEPFSNEVKARRVYRELKLLQLINSDNVIRFADMYTPDRDFRTFKNVYIVSGYAGISLKQILDRQKQMGIRLINHDHVKYIIYQLLRALKYLHSANVIHSDLKPSNLAITEECDLTVLDFGLAMIRLPVLTIMLMILAIATGKACHYKNELVFGGECQGTSCKASHSPTMIGQNHPACKKSGDQCVMKVTVAQGTGECNKQICTSLDGHYSHENKECAKEYFCK